MAKPRIGLALGSGSARGWAHIGVINTLRESGIEADIVSGCSMGAFVGAAMVTGNLDRLDHWVRDLDWKDVIGLMDFRLKGGGFIEGDRLMRYFGERQKDVAIESLDRPFGAIATDLSSGREVWLREGSIFNAVRASVALPGLMSPAKSGDRWLVDGGLVNPVPVSLCRAMGADMVIAVNLNGNIVGKRRNPPNGRKNKSGRIDGPSIFSRIGSEIPEGIRNGADRLFGQIRDSAEARLLSGLFSGGEERPSYIDVVGDSINIMQDHITRSRMAGDPPEVVIAPRLSHIHLMEFNRAEETIEEGCSATRRMMPAIREAIDRLEE
ncbi:MAG: patatin-like phospholipase family protein [Rhodospirillales bacterium]|nr:patatin-like phospholipase family protein [Rhodospirillales bacterium]MCW8861902.1 patatin-like phospholipase family protein [Rhodospirillales bacterium]